MTRLVNYATLSTARSARLRIPIALVSIGSSVANSSSIGIGRSSFVPSGGPLRDYLKRGHCAYTRVIKKVTYVVQHAETTLLRHVSYIPNFAGGGIPKRISQQITERMREMMTIGSRHLFSFLVLQACLHQGFGRKRASGGDRFVIAIKGQYATGRGQQATDSSENLAIVS